MQREKQNFSAMSNFLKGVAVFVGGAVAGAAAAVLLSPKTGKEVREELGDLAKKAKDQAQKCYEQVKTEVENRVKEAEKNKEE